VNEWLFNLENYLIGVLFTANNIPIKQFSERRIFEWQKIKKKI
jgi:hypothetical protein